MSEAENKSLARRLLEEVGNAGAVDRLPEFVASDCRAQLIQDEGHRNRMTVAELEQRMRGWIAGEYRAVIFEAGL